MDYVDVFKELHSTYLQAYENKVQIPWCILFDCRDRHWWVRMRHCGGHLKDRFVEKCFIPSNRIEDFVVGKENSKGTKCHYMHMRISDNNKQPLMHLCINSALYFDIELAYKTMYSCKYTYHFTMIVETLLCITNTHLTCEANINTNGVHKTAPLLWRS